MLEATTRRGEPAVAPLLVCLLELLAAFRPALRQERPYRRCVALVFGSVFAFARHTLSQLLLALGVTEQDWSAWYRLFGVPRVDVEALSAELVRQTLTEMPATGPYVVAVDGVQVPRWSLRLPGTSWLKAPRTPRWKPGIHRAQRFFHLAALLPITRQGYSRALPLRWVPAFPPQACRAGRRHGRRGRPPVRSWAGCADRSMPPAGWPKSCRRSATAATTRPTCGPPCRPARPWWPAAPRTGPCSGCRSRRPAPDAGLGASTARARRSRRPGCTSGPAGSTP